MEGVKRSFLFWFQTIEKFFLTVVLVVVVMCIGMSAISNENFLEMLFLYVPLMGVISIMAMAMNCANTPFPLSISFGATRKETLIGLTIMTHVLIAQMIAVQACCILFLPSREGMSGDVGFYICLLLFIGAMANVVSVLGLRFGNKASFVVYFIFTFVAIVIIAAMSAMEDLSFVVSLIEKIRLSHVVIAAIVIDVLAVFFNFRFIHRYEVKL